MCKFISYAVPEGPPYYANGAYRAVTKCEEHDWIMEGYSTQLPDQPTQCPIAIAEENKHLRAALEKIACRNVTEAPLWWQSEARAVLAGHQ